MRIAILGASGNIGRSLAAFYSQDSRNKLFIFGRSITKIRSIFDKYNISIIGEIASYEDFSKYQYDLILNCIGISDPRALISGENEILAITEYFDNLVIDYLANNSEAKYIFLSSGAIYGAEFDTPVSSDSKFSIEVNNIPGNSFYAISKLYAESKHRSLPQYNIVDLRVFGFVSKYVDIESKLFISDLARCLLNREIFYTSGESFIRDYITVNDIAQLIDKVSVQDRINTPLDLYSKGEIEKFELLTRVREEFQIDFIIDDKFSSINSSGRKNNYFSRNYAAKSIGYAPQESSISGVVMEFKELLSLNI